MEWRTEHQKAFDAITEKLITAPVPAPPRLGKPMIIETDASVTAVAAVLLQKVRRLRYIPSHTRHDCLTSTKVSTVLSKPKP